jgi:hypothetical protein
MWPWSMPVLAVAGAGLLFECGISAAEGGGTVGAAQAPTFTKDVAPILQRACQNCHRPGSIAPMSLLSYKDVRPWARSMKQKVAERDMPPWYIDRHVGIQKFKDDAGLTEQEIATIVRWVDSGSPEGNAADMPPPVKFDELGKWHIKPDLIVTATPYTVKPEQPDQWLDFYVDSGLTEDRYIKEIEGMPSYPDGFRVVHHAHQYLIPPGAEGGEGMGREQTLNEYAVGKNADMFPEGSGRLIKAGTKVHFNLHYHAIGKEVSDAFKLGLVFYPKGVVPKHIEITEIIGSNPETLDIPPGADNVRSDAYHRFAKPVKLTAFQPHMHNRGKRECLEAMYPDGRSEMLNCAAFNFGWALVYNYADDVAPLLPAGTILHVINWHDNSAGHPGNPDPRAWVGWGNRTSDEMSFSWVSWYEMTNEEFKQEVAARRAQSKISENRPPAQH